MVSVTGLPGAIKPLPSQGAGLLLPLQHGGRSHLTSIYFSALCVCFMVDTVSCEMNRAVPGNITWIPRCGTEEARVAGSIPSV